MTDTECAACAKLEAQKQPRVFSIEQRDAEIIAMWQLKWRDQLEDPAVTASVITLAYTELREQLAGLPDSVIQARNARTALKVREEIERKRALDKLVTKTLRVAILCACLVLLFQAVAVIYQITRTPSPAQLEKP